MVFHLKTCKSTGRRFLEGGQLLFWGQRVTKKMKDEPCFHVFLTEAGVKTFVTHFTTDFQISGI